MFDKVAEWLRTSEMVVAIETSWEGRRLARRRALRGELDAFLVEERTTMRPLQEATRLAAHQVQEAEEALGVLRQQHQDAVTAQTSTSLNLGLRRSRLEGELRSTASPVIAECVEKLEALRQDCRVADGVFRTVEGPVFISNAASVSRRVSAIGAALAEVRGWTFEALTDEELQQRFAVLVAALPPIEDLPTIEDVAAALSAA